MAMCVTLSDGRGASKGEWELHQRCLLPRCDGGRECMPVGAIKRVHVFWRPSTSDACSRCAMEGGHGVTHGALKSTAIRAFVSMEGVAIIIMKTCLRIRRVKFYSYIRYFVYWFCLLTSLDRRQHCHALYLTAK